MFQLRQLLEKFKSVFHLLYCPSLTIYFLLHLLYLLRVDIIFLDVNLFRQLLETNTGLRWQMNNRWISLRQLLLNWWVYNHLNNFLSIDSFSSTNFELLKWKIRTQFVRCHLSASEFTSDFFNFSIINQNHISCQVIHITAKFALIRQYFYTQR